MKSKSECLRLSQITFKQYFTLKLWFRLV